MTIAVDFGRKATKQTKNHSGIIEHFDIFKMASKMEDKFKLKNCVTLKNVSNSFFPLNC